MKYKRLYRILIFITIVVLFWFWQTQKSNKSAELNKYLDNRYFRGFNISFSGIVIQRKEAKAGHGDGIYKLKLSSASVKEFDERKTKKYFYCIIKDSYAEIIPDNINYNEINIGDSVAIEGPQKEFKLYRNNKLVINDTLSIQASENDEFGFWKDMREQSEL